ncbi:unnamed protein product [Hapterophycus canaliculatus]
MDVERPRTEPINCPVQGFISSDMCEAHLPKASAETVAFMCGPPAMIKFACIPNLAKMGYTEEDYFNF